MGGSSGAAHVPLVTQHGVVFRPEDFVQPNRVDAGAGAATRR